MNFYWIPRNIFSDQMRERDIINQLLITVRMSFDAGCVGTCFITMQITISIWQLLTYKIKAAEGEN